MCHIFLIRDELSFNKKKVKRPLFFSGLPSVSCWKNFEDPCVQHRCQQETQSARWKPLGPQWSGPLSGQAGKKSTKHWYENECSSSKVKDQTFFLLQNLTADLQKFVNNSEMPEMLLSVCYNATLCRLTFNVVEAKNVKV